MLMMTLLFVLASVTSGATTPTTEIAPGVHLPLVGIGTWQYNDTVSYTAVSAALNIGYEHVDTATSYKNAKGVGSAIKDYLKTSGKKRSDLFITSKVVLGLPWVANLTIEQMATQNLEEMGLDSVDLLLLHMPCALASGKCTGSTALRQSNWKAMESLVHAGKTRAIGVSHYCKRHLQDILAIATIPPAINQVEFHVGMGSAVPNATDDRDFCNAHNITYQSFSPLCGPCGDAGHAALISGPLVTSIGKAHGKSGAQVSLKWQVQQGIPVIPKAQNPQYIREDLDLFGWELSEKEMSSLSAATSPAVSGGPGPTDSGDCGIP